MGYGAGSNEPRYSGKDIGDDKVGELFYVETGRSSMDRGKVHEWVAPMGGHQVAGGKGKIGNKNNSYEKISDGA